MIMNMNTACIDVLVNQRVVKLMLIILFLLIFVPMHAATMKQKHEKARERGQEEVKRGHKR